MIDLLPMTKPRALVRQWTLLRVLSQHVDGLSIDEMARQTAVNARTIRRDLKLFVEAGIPLRETICHRNKKIWRIDHHGTRVLTSYSADEYLALSVVLRMLEPIQSSALAMAIAACRDRVASTLNLSIRRRMEDQLDNVDGDWKSEFPLAKCKQELEAEFNSLRAGHFLSNPMAVGVVAHSDGRSATRARAE